MSKHVVAALDEIPPGSRKRVTVKGRPIAVFNVGGAFFGILDRCPHQGGSLAEGTLCGLVESREPGVYRYSRAGEILRCPWHGWEFDLRTGRSRCEPDRFGVRSYPVAVEAGEALAREPHVAETFAVTVEERYVVVEV
jgi:3-phenylpropionate/trans-cinnamate dioxygenase ferredoxin subunit